MKSYTRPIINSGNPEFEDKITVPPIIQWVIFFPGILEKMFSGGFQLVLVNTI